MFQQTIQRGVPLTGEDADLFFERVVGEPVLRDHSFLATLRAFLGTRMGEEDRFAFCVTEITGPENIESYEPGENRLDLLYIRSINSDKRQQLFSRAKDKITSHGGYSPVEKIAQYYGRVCNILAVTDESKKSAIILVDQLDTRRLHLLQGCIPVILPWYFPSGPDGKKQLSPDELSLIASLEKKDDKEYRKALTKLAQQYDMREMIIRKRLDGVAKRVHEVELRNMEERVSRLTEHIRNSYREIEGYMRDRSDVITRVYGLKERLKEGGGASDLVDYFLYNQAVFLHGVSGTVIHFTCAGHLENWDDDKAESIINNRNSFLYDHARDNDIDVDGFQKLMRAIFLDREVFIRVYADYELDLGGHLDTEHFETHDPSLMEYMENPHIEGFDCLGDYKYRVLECISDGNILQAFDYCVASSRSLNWADSPVMSHFARNICYEQSDLACYELPDGRVVALQEAVKWANNR